MGRSFANDVAEEDLPASYPEGLIPLIVLPPATLCQIREATCVECGQISGHWCCAKMGEEKQVAGVEEDDVFDVGGDYHAM